MITQMVNVLSAKSEIGSPMASMYLLKQPDHYTSHKFVRFYWKQYVYEVKDAFQDSTTDDNLPHVDTTDTYNSKVVLGQNSQGIMCMTIHIVQTNTKM